MAFSMAPTETFAAANTEENGRAEGRVSDAEDTLSDTEPLNELWNQQEEPENGGNAAQTEEEQESEEPLSLDEPSMEEDILKNWMPPMGGVEQPKVVEISEETAESLEIIEPQEAADGTLEYRSSVLGSKQYDSSWDVYSSNYIYNRLNENERKLWDALDLVARGYLHGTENAVRVAVQGEYYYAAQKGVSFTFMGVTYDRAADLFTMFSYSNPQYYFIGNGFLSNGSSMFPMIYDGFANGATRAAETAKVKAQIDTMEAQIAAGCKERPATSPRSSEP